MRTLVALALLPLCAPPLLCQIIVIQGSDPISSSRGVINSNFSYLESQKVPIARTLTTGAGLQGGGDLSANRTLTLAQPTVSTLGGIMSKVCAGTDKVSAIGGDGIPVCTADTGGSGSVTSFMTRTGAVTAQLGDYAATLITFTPVGAIAAVNVQVAINELDAEKQPIATGLTALGGLAVTDDTIAVANGATWQSKGIPTCSNATSSKLLYDIASNAFSCGVDQTSGGGGAPTNATYITQTADAGLSAEQALSSLATGVVKVTTGTGALSVVTGTASNCVLVDGTSSTCGAGGGATTDLGLTGLQLTRTTSTTLAMAAGGYVPMGKAAVTSAGGNFTSSTGSGSMYLCAGASGLLTVQGGTLVLSARPAGVADGGLGSACLADTREIFRWQADDVAGQWDATSGTPGDQRYAITSPAPCNSTADVTATRNVNGGCDYTAPATIAQRSSIQSGAYLYAAGTGSATVATATVTGFTAYTEGQTILYQPEDTNSTTQTLNINGVGAKSILTASGAALAAGDLTAGRYYPLTYDGTAFRLPPAGGGGGGSTKMMVTESISTGSYRASAVMDTRLSSATAAVGSSIVTANGYSFFALSFADAVTQLLSTHFTLPTNWLLGDGMTIKLKAFAISGASANVVFTATTGCVADGEASGSGIAFNSTTTTTFTQAANPNQSTHSLIPTLTNCAAGETMHVLLSRTGAAAADTSAVAIAIAAIDFEYYVSLQ